MIAGLRQRVQSLVRHAEAEGSLRLGDFTADRRMIFLSVVSIGLGVIGAGVAWILLRLIGIITNFAFFGRWGTKLVSPAGNHLGLFEIVIPIIGGLIVGVMARYGSERIRGHGIPEAIEAVLINGSKVEPQVAVLKPVSSAISIGTGGPFGAEGPIIMTGGAVGSLVAQFLDLTSAERKTLLAAGAAAGMSATFSSPVAAVLLAVEVLLFEWKPRSLIPVALASATAAAVRFYILGAGPLWPIPHPTAFVGIVGLLACIACGLLAGVLSTLVTNMVYAAEDGFRKLPIHWMWWPAIGGLVIGIGGLIFPQALGVGYDIIGKMLRGDIVTSVFFGILIVKSLIWSISLGSGTSGGVLAPLLLMGGSLGGLEAHVFPHEGVGFWPLIGMAAALSGTLRAPFTATIFTLEVTHDIGALLPILIACMVAHGFAVLVMRRSILTEKVARRGYHLTQEYAVDPLEVLLVREVMRNNVVMLPVSSSVSELPQSLNGNRTGRSQPLFPVVNEHGGLVGVVTRKDLQRLEQEASATGTRPRLADIVMPRPVVAYPDEPLRRVVYRMAETGLTRFPVVTRGPVRKVVGMVALTDLLRARERDLAEERRRERVIHMRLLGSRHAPAELEEPPEPEGPQLAPTGRRADTSAQADVSTPTG